jgi:cytochrome c553
MEIPGHSHYHSALTQSRVPGRARQHAHPDMKKHTNFARAVAAVILAALAGHAAAQGDAEADRELGYTCLGCHGIEGQRNAYPSFRVPRLGGQKSAYVETALNAYRSGARPHPTMQAQAATLTDDDVANLLAWLATFGEAGDTATAEQVAGVEAAKVCVTCHGVAGAEVMPAPPVLAGQHKDYLVHALKQYRDGTRGANVMAAFATTLSDADMALIAGFYASQEGLQTLDE